MDSLDMVLKEIKDRSFRIIDTDIGDPANAALI